MRKIIVIIAILLIGSSVYAGRWCEWSGTEGINCVNDRNGVLQSPTNFPTRTESIINSWGVFRVTTTQPAIGVDQVRDAEIWDKVDNQISLTWSMRDMTVAEIDIREAGPMPLSEYFLWKTMIVVGVITQQQAVNNLPQELIDAYLARDRILNP